MFGIFAAIGSVVGAVCSTVTSAANTLISCVANTIATSFSNSLSVVAEALKTIGAIVSLVAQYLGLAPVGEDVCEIGAKAMQEGVREKREDESMSEYMDYIRNEVELDKEKFANMSEEEKLKCTAVGIGMEAENIREKYGVELSPVFLNEMAKMKLDQEHLAKYIEGFSEKRIDSMDYLSDFLKGELDDAETVHDVESVIIDTEKELNPESTDADIKNQIYDMKDTMNSEEA